MLEQVLAQPAQPLVLPDLSYPNYSENSDNPFATPYHIAPSSHPHLFSDRPRSYLVDGLSSIVSSALESKLPQRPYSASLHSDNPELPTRDHEAERREYERQLTDSPALSPPASSPSSATHRSAYKYDHRPSFDRIATTPSPDAMYNHPRTDDSITPNDPYPSSGENAPRTSYNSRPSPLPSIITANLLAQTAPADPYSESPLSSPSDVNHSSFSHPHPEWQFRPRDPALERYTFPQHPNPILDRRMSEPIIRSLYHATHPDSYQYLSAQADSPSTAATVVPATPHSVSPRPPTLSYSSYPSFPPHHQRAGSGTSIGSGSNQDSVDSWGPLKHPHQQAPTEQEVAALGGSPSCSAGVPPSETAVQGIAIGTSSPSSRGNPQSEGVAGGNGSGTPGSKNDKKTYSFVSLPGNAVKKRPRRRYDEIERLYQCNYPNCTKSYGTLNHLNAHVTMQKHGSKRSPGEFKELRKQWRLAKKEAEEHEREREREARALSLHHASHQHPIDLHPHLRGEGHLRGDGLVVRHGPRRRISLVDPYPDPHGFPPHHHSNPPHAGGLYGYGGGPASDNSSSQARFGIHSPADELRYSSHLGQEIAPELPAYYRQQQQSEAHGPGGGWHTSDLRHHQQPAHHGMSMSLPTSRPIHQASYFHHQASHSSPAQYSLQQEQQQTGEEDLEEPLLTSHVSLGSNRLPPDSTLLTPLPGFVPDAEHAQLLEGSGGVMGAMGPGMPGSRYDPSYGMGRDREDF